MPITLVLLALGVVGFTASAVLLKKKKTARILCMILCAAIVLLTAAWMGLTAYFVWAVGQDAPQEIEDNPSEIQNAPTGIPDGPAVAEDGGDWHTWRSYTGDYAVKDDLSVTLSPLDGGKGYAVYNASTGERIGTLLDGTGQEEILCEDIDGDGVCELGIALSSGTVWYRYTGSPWVEGTGGGGFERVE